jgi:hypothetical protein
MNASYLHHLVDKIACEILGHKPKHRRQVMHIAKKTYEYIDCKRCNLILDGQAPDFAEELLEIYTPTIMNSMIEDETPFRRYLKSL